MWLTALFFLILTIGGIYYYSKSVKAIATLGSPSPSSFVGLFTIG